MLKSIIIHLKFIKMDYNLYKFLFFFAKFTVFSAYAHPTRFLNLLAFLETLRNHILRTSHFKPTSSQVWSPKLNTLKLTPTHYLQIYPQTYPASTYPPTSNLPHSIHPSALTTPTYLPSPLFYYLTPHPN